MNSIQVKRSKLLLHSARNRVLIRPFNVTTEERAVKICARASVLPEEEVRQVVNQMLAEFNERHLKIRTFLMQRFEQVRHWIPSDKEISDERKLLIGAYFSHEYSFEAAALFNP